MLFRFALFFIFFASAGTSNVSAQEIDDPIEQHKQLPNGNANSGLKEFQKSIDTFANTITFSIPKGFILASKETSEDSIQLDYELTSEGGVEEPFEKITIRAHNPDGEGLKLNSTSLLELSIGIMNRMCPKSFHSEKLGPAKGDAEVSVRAIYGCTGVTLFNNPEADKRLHEIHVLQIFENNGELFEARYSYRINGKIDTDKQQYFLNLLDQLSIK